MLKNLLKNIGVVLGIFLVGGIVYHYYQKNELYEKESQKMTNLLKKKELSEEDIESMDNFKTSYKYMAECIFLVKKINNEQIVLEKDFHYLYRVIHRFFIWKFTVALAIILNSYHIKDSRVLNLFMDMKLLMSPVSGFLNEVKRNVNEMNKDNDLLDEDGLKKYIDQEYKRK